MKLEDFIERIKPFLIEYFKGVVEGEEIVKAAEEEKAVIGTIKEIGFYLCDNGKVKIIEGDEVSTPVYKAGCNIIGGLHTHPIAPAIPSKDDVDVVRKINPRFDCIATRRNNKIVINCVEEPKVKELNKCRNKAFNNWMKSNSLALLEVYPGVFIPTSNNKDMERAEKMFKECYKEVKTFEIPLSDTESLPYEKKK